MISIQVKRGLHIGCEINTAHLVALGCIYYLYVRYVYVVVLQDEQIHHQVAAAASGKRTTQLANTTWLVRPLRSVISTCILNGIDNSVGRKARNVQGSLPDSQYSMRQY